jgi:hypothetical protein
MFFVRATRQPHFEDAARDFNGGSDTMDISAEMHNSYVDFMPSEILSLLVLATKTLIPSMEMVNKYLHEVDS